MSDILPKEEITDKGNNEIDTEVLIKDINTKEIETESIIKRTIEVTMIRCGYRPKTVTEVENEKKLSWIVKKFLTITSIILLCSTALTCITITIGCFTEPLYITSSSNWASAGIIFAIVIGLFLFFQMSSIAIIYFIYICWVKKKQPHLN